MQLSDDSIYRIKILDDTNRLSLLHIGMDCLDQLPDGEYDWDEIPTWMQDKLAVLFIMGLPPPPTEVETVGKRINERIFWVYS